MNCHLCGTEAAQLFNTQVLGKYAARYAYCVDHFPLGRIHLSSRQPLSRWHLRLGSNKLLVVPIALYALWRLGSRRASEQHLRKMQSAPPHA